MTPILSKVPASHSDHYLRAARVLNTELASMRDTLQILREVGEGTPVDVSFLSADLIESLRAIPGIVFTTESEPKTREVLTEAASFDAPTLMRAIQWAINAAQEHVLLAKHQGEDPDPEWSFGLRDSFAYDFPKLGNPRAFETYANAASTAYSSAVKAMMGIK